MFLMPTRYLLLDLGEIDAGPWRQRDTFDQPATNVAKAAWTVESRLPVGELARPGDDELRLMKR
jgi:hypothetical protein